MDFELVALLAVTGGIWLGMMGIGSRVWLRKKELESGGSASKDVMRAVEDLREEMSQIRASQEQQITELHERLDFAERMLVQKSQPRAIEGAESTPL